MTDGSVTSDATNDGGRLVGADSKELNEDEVSQPDNDEDGGYKSEDSIVSFCCGTTDLGGGG